jgi:hypothetical protein
LTVGFFTVKFTFMGQLRKDLHRRIRERHRLWLKDSVALYEMAGLPQDEAVYDVLYTLIVALIGGLRANNVSQEQALALLDDWVKRLERQEKNGVQS